MTFFTINDEFFGNSVRQQAPLLSIQGHAIYNADPRWWAAVDGTYYTGGRTTLNGSLDNDLQSNSRWGATLAYNLDRHNSVKTYFSSGLTARTGTEFKIVGIAWQYSLGGRALIPEVVYAFTVNGQPASLNVRGYRKFWAHNRVEATRCSRRSVSRSASATSSSEVAAPQALGTGRRSNHLVLSAHLHRTPSTYREQRDERPVQIVERPLASLVERLVWVETASSPSGADGLLTVYSRPSCRNGSNAAAVDVAFGTAHVADRTKTGCSQ